MATGKFLPPEITKMILGALKDPQSDSNSDSDSDSG